MTFDLNRYKQYLKINNNGDGWLVVEDCPSKITEELKEINQEYLKTMSVDLIIFSY